MELKQSASRRVSASTIAPIAPSESSSQMNRNRSWPGVPNRYRTRSAVSVMRPKSIATVVVALVSTPSMSSTPTLSSVRYSSVSSGWISLTAPTSVVLPTPKPPAMRILSATGMSSSSGAPVAPSKGAKAIEDRLENTLGGLVVRRHGRSGPDVAPVEEIAEQDPHRPHREVEVRRQFGDRHRILTEPHDAGVLGLEPDLRPAGQTGRHHERDQVELAPGRPGPAVRHRVMTDDRPGRLVHPYVVGILCHAPRLLVRARAGPGRRGQVLADPRDDHRHLVRDEADVRVLGAEHGQAGPVTAGGDEEEAGLHLDDGLAHRAPAEPAPGAPGQAVQAGGDGRQMLGVLAPQVHRLGDEQAVVGEHDRVLDMGYATDQVIDQPADIDGRACPLSHEVTPSRRWWVAPMWSWTHPHRRGSGPRRCVPAACPRGMSP